MNQPNPTFWRDFANVVQEGGDFEIRRRGRISLPHCPVHAKEMRLIDTRQATKCAPLVRRENRGENLVAICRNTWDEGVESLG